MNGDAFWTAVVTSLIASLIFGLFFSFIPSRIRYFRIRPRVENDLSSITNQLLHFLEYKICSLIKYYYKTLILLFENKKDGVQLAKQYSRNLKKLNYIFWKSTRKRYTFLSVLNFFHINGTQIFKIKSSIPIIYNKVFKLFR